MHEPRSFESDHCNTSNWFVTLDINLTFEIDVVRYKYKVMYNFHLRGKTILLYFKDKHLLPQMNQDIVQSIFFVSKGMVNIKELKWKKTSVETNGDSLYMLYWETNFY